MESAEVVESDALVTLAPSPPPPTSTSDVSLSAMEVEPTTEVRYQPSAVPPSPPSLLPSLSTPPSDAPPAASDPPSTPPPPSSYPPFPSPSSATLPPAFPSSLLPSSPDLASSVLTSPATSDRVDAEQRSQPGEAAAAVDSPITADPSHPQQLQPGEVTTADVDVDVVAPPQPANAEVAAVDPGEAPSDERQSSASEERPTSPSLLPLSIADLLPAPAPSSEDLPHSQADQPIEQGQSAVPAATVAPAADDVQEMRGGCGMRDEDLSYDDDSQPGQLSAVGEGREDGKKEMQPSTDVTDIHQPMVLTVDEVGAAGHQQEDSVQSGVEAEGKPETLLAADDVDSHHSTVVEETTSAPSPSTPTPSSAVVVDQGSVAPSTEQSATATGEASKDEMEKSAAAPVPLPLPQAIPLAAGMVEEGKDSAVHSDADTEEDEEDDDDEEMREEGATTDDLLASHAAQPSPPPTAIDSVAQTGQPDHFPQAPSLTSAALSPLVEGMLPGAEPRERVELSARTSPLALSTADPPTAASVLAADSFLALYQSSAVSRHSDEAQPSEARLSEAQPSTLAVFDSAPLSQLITSTPPSRPSSPTRTTAPATAVDDSSKDTAAEAGEGQQKVKEDGEEEDVALSREEVEVEEVAEEVEGKKDEEEREEEAVEEEKMSPSTTQAPPTPVPSAAIVTRAPPSPTFGMTQEERSDDEEASSDMQLHEQDDVDLTQTPSLPSPAPTVTPQPAVEQRAQPDHPVQEAGSDVCTETVTSTAMEEDVVQSQQLPPSQRSVVSTVESIDADAFMLDDDEEVEDELTPRSASARNTAQHSDGPLNGLQRGQKGAVDEVNEVDEEVGEEREPVERSVVDAEHSDDAAEDDDFHSRASPRSPAINSPTRSLTSSPSHSSQPPSPVYSQSDVDALHSHVASLQQTIAAQATQLKRQGEVEEMVRVMQEEMDAERRTLLEQKQRLIHQLQMEKAELADRLREAANEKGKREAEALTERDATQAKLTAAVEQVQGKELELTTLRNDRERLQQQALMRLRTVEEKMQGEVGQLQRLLEQREGELAQLTSTPLAHRVDGLQQQLAAAISEKEEAVKKVGEAELKLKAAKREGKEQRRAVEKEKEVLDARVRDLSSALQDLAIKHSELTARLSHAEETKRSQAEQLRVSEADRKELTTTQRELTRLQVMVEMTARELELLKREKKEGREELKAQREEVRALHERLRAQQEGSAEAKAAMQALLDQAKVSLASANEKVITHSERCIAATTQLNSSQREAKALKAENERYRTAGHKLEDEQRTTLAQLGQAEADRRAITAERDAYARVKQEDDHRIRRLQEELSQVRAQQPLLRAPTSQPPSRMEQAVFPASHLAPICPPLLPPPASPSSAPAPPPAPIADEPGMQHRRVASVRGQDRTHPRPSAHPTEQVQEQLRPQTRSSAAPDDPPPAPVAEDTAAESLSRAVASGGGRHGAPINLAAQPSPPAPTIGDSLAEAGLVSAASALARPTQKAAAPMGTTAGRSQRRSVMVVGNAAVVNTEGRRGAPQQLEKGEPQAKETEKDRVREKEKESVVNRVSARASSSGARAAATTPVNEAAVKPAVAKGKRAAEVDLTTASPPSAQPVIILTGQEKANLVELGVSVAQLGGRLCPEQELPSHDVTHCVMTTASQCTLKSLLSGVHGAWLLDVSWLYASFAAGQWLKEADYGGRYFRDRTYEGARVAFHASFDATITSGKLKLTKAIIAESNARRVMPDAAHPDSVDILLVAPDEQPPAFSKVKKCSFDEFMMGMPVWVWLKDRKAKAEAQAGPNAANTGHLSDSVAAAKRVKLNSRASTPAPTNSDGAAVAAGSSKARRTLSKGRGGSDAVDAPAASAAQAMAVDVTDEGSATAQKKRSSHAMAIASQPAPATRAAAPAPPPPSLPPTPVVSDASGVFVATADAASPSSSTSAEGRRTRPRREKALTPLEQEEAQLQKALELSRQADLQREERERAEAAQQAAAKHSAAAVEGEKQATSPPAPVGVIAATVASSDSTSAAEDPAKKERGSGKKRGAEAAPRSRVEEQGKEGGDRSSSEAPSQLSHAPILPPLIPLSAIDLGTDRKEAKAAEKAGQAMEVDDMGTARKPRTRQPPLLSAAPTPPSAAKPPISATPLDVGDAECEVVEEQGKRSTKPQRTAGARRKTAELKEKEGEEEDVVEQKQPPPSVPSSQRPSAAAGKGKVTPARVGHRVAAEREEVEEEKAGVAEQEEDDEELLTLTPSAGKRGKAPASGGAVKRKRLRRSGEAQ